MSTARVTLIRLGTWLFGHWYYSTSCLHGRHDHCRSDIAIDGGVKVAGQCKWCDAWCRCRCHRKARAV